MQYVGYIVSPIIEEYLAMSSLDALPSKADRATLSCIGILTELVLSIPWVSRMLRIKASWESIMQQLGWSWVILILRN